MTMLLLIPFAFLQLSFHDSLPVQTDLQGLYAEMSQAALLTGSTDAEIDDFHDVLCTTDWVFIDMHGGRHDWQDMREQTVRLLTGPPLDSMVQTIQQLALAPGSATVIVQMTTVRSLVGARATERTFFRDTWVETPEGWKLKSREQLTPAKEFAVPLEGH